MEGGPQAASSPSREVNACGGRRAHGNRALVTPVEGPRCPDIAWAERLSYRSADGDRPPFADPVDHRHLPILSDAAPNTVKGTASHLGDDTGSDGQKTLRRTGRPQPVRSRPVQIGASGDGGENGRR